MQAVELFAVWVFASGIGSWRCGLFCHGVGVPQGQLYAAVFVVLGGLRKCKPWSFLRGGFLSAVFVPGVYAAVFVVLGGLRKCKPFILSRCFFLHAVLVPGGAVYFVVGCVAWVFFKKISRFGLLFIVNFYFQNSISRQQCTDSVQNHKVDTLARYIAYSRVK